MAQSPGYIACTITLTAATPTNLLAALQAAFSTITFPVKCRELLLQNNSGNNTATLVGDQSVSTTRMGIELAVGSTTLPAGQRLYGNTGGAAQVPLASIWLLNAGSSQKVNVEIVA